MKRLTVVLVCIAVVGGLLLFTSCETEPVGSSISLSPTSAELKEGESVQFTVSGGYDYTWSLSSEAYGTLSSRTNSTTTYTSIANLSTNSSPVQVVLTVNSHIVGQSSSQALASAEAYILHMPEDPEPTPTEDLSVSSTGSFPLDQWESASFTVSGGSGTYSWWLLEPSWGRLDVTVGSSVTYICLYADDDTSSTNVELQILYVIDSDGGTASYSITENH